MRSAGCVVNDLWDMKIDAQVDRTKDRPLASGEIMPREALPLLAGLLAVGALGLTLLNGLAIALAFVAAGMAAMYPLAKRATPAPQFFLGMTFNAGALISYAALTDSVTVSALILYAGGTFLTVGYDTIYAVPDAPQDEKLGLRSTVLLFGEHIREAVAACYGAAFALFALAGLMESGAAPLYVIAGAAPGALWAWQAIYSLDLRSVDACRVFFERNALLALYVSVFMALS